MHLFYLIVKLFPHHRIRLIVATQNKFEINSLTIKKQ